MVVWLCAFHFKETPELNAGILQATCAMQSFTVFLSIHFMIGCFQLGTFNQYVAFTEKRIGSGPISRQL